MSQYNLLKATLSVTLGGLIGISTTTYAEQISWGDADTALGKITVSGWIRANYQDKDYSTADHKLQFNAAKLSLKYDAEKLFGDLEYRCYQNDTLCDFSTLVNASLGYKFTEDSRITLGLQDMPYGMGRFWTSTWYGSGLDNAGLEDVHNLGVNWQHQLSDKTIVNLAYFAQDGGDYVGVGDAARYSANYVKPDQLGIDNIEEKNMWVARIQQQFEWTDHPIKLNVGGSYWYSDLDNLSNGQTGHRNAWNVFGHLKYQNANFTLTAGQNRADTKSVIQADFSTIGSFESKYLLANKINYYVANVDYTFKNIYQDYDLISYMSYTIIDKEKAGFSTSSRSILGAQVDIKDFSVAAEYITGKSDVFIGGDEYALAMGDRKDRSNLLNLLFIYNF